MADGAYFVVHPELPAVVLPVERRAGPLWESYRGDVHVDDMAVQRSAGLPRGYWAIRAGKARRYRGPRPMRVGSLPHGLRQVVEQACRRVADMAGVERRWTPACGEQLAGKGR